MDGLLVAQNNQRGGVIIRVRHMFRPRRYALCQIKRFGYLAIG